MAKELIFTETFKRNYQELPKELQKRFDNKLSLFLENPKHPSLNIHRYQTNENIWEAYISEKYRFTFSVSKEAITFRNIGPHSIIDKGQV
ncbi:MAG: hypothetical protein HY810_06680 [Candidatus Omnitrophica bacterium]|nr:hypothetical protein [Candidatus Omnitrophota bacterium]